MNTTHHTYSCVHDTVSSVGANNFGMNDRIKRLRRQTFEAQPSLSIERALIETRFYQENYGKYPIPILRALNFLGDLQAEDDLYRRGRVDRRRAGAPPQGRAYLPGTYLP